MKTYADFGIRIERGDTGEVRAVCPECSPHRKPGNQNERDLSVNTERGVWNCHHCGWAGNLEAGADKKTNVIGYEANLSESVVRYMAGRGISKETLITHNTGYKSGEPGKPGAIMFPRYKRGLCVAIKYRRHDKQMWQSTNPASCFYNYDNAAKSKESALLITEGEIDSLSWTEAGILANASVPNGAPPPSAKNLDKFFEFLNDGLKDKFSSYILATDNDEPGKMLREELAERLGPHKCSIVAYPDGCKDANDVLVKHGAEKLREIHAAAKPLPVAGLYSAGDVESAVLDLYQCGLKPGLSTGWPNMDDFYTVREAEMTIITGIPGSGKSTWLDALTVNLHRNHGWKFAYCSPENWPIQRHIASIIEKMSGKPFGKDTQYQARIEQDEMLCYLDAMRENFYFTQLRDRDMKIDSILDVMQAAIDRHGVKGVILDPWNELEHHRPANISETEFISSALGKIRRFARLNNVHVWIVAHPTKLKKNDDGTYPVPRLYDIAGSAHFFNKADNGIAVHRRELKTPRVEIHVQKIRFKEIGKPGACYMNFVYSSGTYLPAEVYQQECESKPSKF